MAKKQPLVWRVLTAFARVIGGERAVEYVNNSPEDEPPSGGLRRYGYQRATQRGYEPIVDWISNVTSARDAWQRNPVAQRAEEIKVGYIWGSGAQIIAEDEALADIATDFWARNRLASVMPGLIAAWSRYGALVMPAFVRQSDGAITLAYHDPSAIDSVILHPDNALERWAVVIKPAASADAWMEAQGTLVYRIVRKQRGIAEPERVETLREPAGFWKSSLTLDDSEQLVTAEQARLEPWELRMLREFGLGAYSGTCLYLTKNADPNQGLGRSDLLPVIDWLGGLDDILWAMVEREKYAGFYAFDVEITGADTEKLQERASEIARCPPERGTVNLHNEKETWNMFLPDLKQAASIEAYKAVFGHVWGGLGFPVSWYSRGDETNRATAQAQGDPTWRSLQMEQSAIAALLAEILEFARDQAHIAGALPYTEPPDIRAELPPMVVSDTVAMSSAFSAAMSAVLTALDAVLITRHEAAEIAAKLAGAFGVDIDLSRAELDAPHRPLTAMPGVLSVQESVEVRPVPLFGDAALPGGDA